MSLEVVDQARLPARSAEFMQGYSQFARQVELMRGDICREIFHHNRDRIRVKNEGVAVERLNTVFDKTLEISNRIGFQAMSVRDLSDATGISMGALYSYIESKETLLDMVMALGRLAARRVLHERPDTAQSAAERLRTLLRMHLYLTEAMQPWFYFSYMESRHFDREAREQAIDSELHSEAVFVECLRDGVAEGVFVVRDTELTAALIKPLLQDWYLKRWKYRRRQVGVDAYADAVIAFVEAAVVARPMLEAGASAVQTDKS